MFFKQIVYITIFGLWNDAVLPRYVVAGLRNVNGVAFQGVTNSLHEKSLSMLIYL